LASLEHWKTITDIVSNAATVVAIGVGAVWAYWRFVRERTRWPRALLELVVTHRGLSKDRALLNITVKVHNGGAGLMRLTQLRLYVYRVLPLQGDSKQAVETRTLIPNEEFEAQWPCIEKATRTWETGSCPEIEPHENDEYVHDFLISTAEETLFVYGHLKNEKRARGAREVGWQVTTFYDLTGASGQHRADNVPGKPQMSEHEEKQQRPRPEPRPEKIEEGQQEPRPEPDRQPEPEPDVEQQEPRPEPEVQGADD
jgi:hypothetical protein